MKKWQCTVCGYVHTGDDPPEICPVCGADSSKFIEIASEETGAKSSEETGRTGLYGAITGLILENHIHPISVHIPNGVLPVSVTFVIMAVVFQIANFDLAAFYNLIFVVLAMPMVLFSGYVEWSKRYGGAMTNVFLTKIICGMVVFFISLILVVWRIADPDVAMSTSQSRWPYLLLHLIMLAAAGVAGHLGGNLVFAQDRGEKTCK